MFKKPKRISVLAALLAVPLGATGAMADGQTVVLRGARVLTMDGAKPEAQAIALVEGKIAAVGSDADIEPYLKGAKVYDLPAGALVLPGFQDDHNHLIWSATQAEDISLTDVSDEAGLRAAIEPAMAKLPKDVWLRGGGWSVGVYKEPSAKALDAITGDRLAYFDDVDGHSGWANSAALKLAGIDASTKDPEGGRIERDTQGNPTGLLRENAMSLVSSLLPEYPDAQVDAGLAKGQAEAMSFGITAIIDPSTEEWMLKGYQRADAEDKLKLRVEAAVKIDAEEGPDGVYRVQKLKNQYTSPHLEVTSVKLFVDGVIETGTAALLEAYVGSNSAGDALFTPEILNGIAIAADRVHLQLHAHAIGDRAVRMALDAFEAVEKANGKRDSRHQITHLELIDPADIERFKELGVVANIQALWVYPDTYIVDLTQPKIGPERSEWLYPFGALKKAGATIVGSSDWSVSSMNPLEAIQTGVTRQDIADPNGKVLTPQHKLDVMDMLRAYTVNAAYAAFDETDSGTLTVGKRADVVVLDRDVTKIPATEIASGKVLVTLIDGEAVYEAEGVAGK
ncbi:amidohydrolase [Mesorhizobium sp. LHD-90]|uniref:amidohydrolase n=1 Tax=Mesorhizobium sp. LHD-90 TaxID=3071414 RepID=UPI0027DF90D7|nr:amidohydrolase [Mesorhizobium sp. LHD-90]MDQ6435387.1 amidohydrolase [Mesorhizobium sp. LHD-90]